MSPRNYLICLALSLGLTGCSTYKHPTTEFVKPYNSSITLQSQAATNKLYNIIPRHRSQLSPLDIRWTTWALLGNDDNGIFGECQYRPYSTNISSRTFLDWTTRNPLHNLFFYTIGSAGKTNHSTLSLIDISTERTKFFSHQTQTFNPGNSGFELVFNDFKPYFSFHFPSTPSTQFQFYLGWRHRGNFGLKFKPFSKNR